MKVYTKVKDCFTQVEEIENINVKELVSERFVYEFTITFNPKYFPTKQSMLDMIEYIILKLKFKVCDRRYDYDGVFFDYVIEYHKSGIPHLHGTVLSPFKWPNSKIYNVEQFFNREIGKTMIYYTGNEFKYHPDSQKYWNDYILKDNPETYEQIIIYDKHFFKIDEVNIQNLNSNQ